MKVAAAWFLELVGRDSTDAIVAYTLDLPDENRGVALVFRRETAPDTFTFRLPGAFCDAEYLLKIRDEELEKEVLTVSGGILRRGFDVHIKAADASLIIGYKRL